MSIFENKILQIMLLPVSFIYGLIIKVRNFCYEARIISTKKIGQCKIISIGNISVGGTGKTPVVKYLAGYLQGKGLKVAVLSRGYKRQSSGTLLVSDGKNILANFRQAGDEPYLLANTLKNVVIVVEADRFKGGLFISKLFRPDVILLDDAFQHRRIYHDVDIALIDASRGFGNGHLLPSGFLREPISSLKRAQLIWLTRVDQCTDLSSLNKIIQQVNNCPQITSSHAPACLIQIKTKKSFDPSLLNKKKVLLFSGIANNESFEKTIFKLGAEIVYHKKFSDHYPYSKRDIDEIKAQMEKLQVEMGVTTEKDYFRLTDVKVEIENFYYLTIDIKIEVGENFLDNVAHLFNLRSPIQRS
jgi:tetraacyldisaccharide 4'-kinase